jgi:hypothetical protein
MNSSQHLKITRIGLIVAIIASFAVGVLNGFKVREKIQRLQSSLTEQTAARQKAENELAASKRELGVTSAALSRTKAEFQAVTEEKNAAVSKAASQRERAERLANDLATTHQERDDARTQLARYRAPGLEPEQIMHAAELMKQFRKDLGVATARNKFLEQEVEELKGLVEGNHPEIKLPAALDGEVVAFDPRWQFVVVNVGEEQGVLKGGHLLVNRAGKLVAKVVVARVEKNRCIGTVMPGWALGEIVEGDRAIPAYPRS